MVLLSPISRNTAEPAKPLYKSSNRILRILYRFNTYKALFAGSLRKGIGLADLVRAQFPYSLPDAQEPPIVVLELTNYCNLKCPYCTSTLALRKRGYMSEEVFAKIISDLKKMKPNRIQFIGNGEPTLHPKFAEFVAEAGKLKKFVSIVTNGQWLNDKVPYLLLDAPFDLIEFSVDAGGKEAYEASRINGSYEKLLNNIKLVRKLRDDKKSKTLINVRLMVRPSQQNNRKEEQAFWKQYADTVMPQFISKVGVTKYDDDIFTPVTAFNNIYPKCSLPFKHMEIKWSGDVLLCTYSAFQMKNDGLLLGNVLESSVKGLWNSEIMKQYRDAHRKRIEGMMPVCQGCQGT